VQSGLRPLGSYPDRVDADRAGHLRPGEVIQAAGQLFGLLGQLETMWQWIGDDPAVTFSY